MKTHLKTFREENNMDATKFDTLYSKIARIITKMIPEKWSKVYLFCAKEEDTQQSFFYYYPTTNDKPVYSLDIPEMFEMNDDQYEDLKDQLFDYLENLWMAFKQNGNEPWTTFTMNFDDSGHFQSEYGYEELKFGPFQRRLIWEYNHLGIVPTDDYAKEVLEEGLKEMEDPNK